MNKPLFPTAEANLRTTELKALCSGSSPSADWINNPPDFEAVDLLLRLDALEHGTLRITRIGQRMLQYMERVRKLNARLARVLVEAENTGVFLPVATICAMLINRSVLRTWREMGGTSDRTAAKSAHTLLLHRDDRSDIERLLRVFNMLRDAACAPDNAFTDCCEQHFLDAQAFDYASNSLDFIMSVADNPRREQKEATYDDLVACFLAGNADKLMTALPYHDRCRATLQEQHFSISEECAFASADTVSLPAHWVVMESGRGCTVLATAMMQVDEQQLRKHFGARITVTEGAHRYGDDCEFDWEGEEKPVLKSLKTLRLDGRWLDTTFGPALHSPESLDYILQRISRGLRVPAHVLEAAGQPLEQFWSKVEKS